MSLLERLLASRARHDAVAFASQALWDERTGKPVALAPHQRSMLGAWQSRARTVQLAPSEFGKSVLLAVWLAWRIGRDPSLRVGLLSATREQAVRLLRLVSIVMHGRAYRRCFPANPIERVTADEISVLGRPSSMKDANVQAAAFDLSSMLGSRFDVAACDDVVSREAVRTQAARDTAYQGFLSVTASRVAPDGEIHVVGTAEHTDDVPHRLAKLPGWSLQSYPALDSSGEPIFKARWPIERIEARRLELGPVGFARAMLCIPLDEARLVFRPEDLERALGLGRDTQYSPIGGRVIVACDPAWTVTATADESGIVMVTIDSDGFRHVVHVEGLKCHHDALAERVVNLAQSNRATVYCESNGAGGVIASTISKRVPCKALATTATSKRARVEALSAELASGRWVFRQPLGYPSPELRKLCAELGTFSLDSHAGDRASALLIAVEGARSFEARPKGRWFTHDLFTR